MRLRADRGAELCELCCAEFVINAWLTYPNDTHSRNVSSIVFILHATFQVKGGGQITFYNLERYVLVSTVSLKTNKNRVAGRQPLATININTEVIKCSTFIPLLLFIVHTDSESALSFYTAPTHPPTPMNLIVI